MADNPAPLRTELVAVERKPHRARPACVARELLNDRGDVVPAPKYPWCDRPAHYLWGEQHLCRGHAWKLMTRRRVSGITPSGRWGGCLWHIDCSHSIDDPAWETFSTLSPADARSIVKGLMLRAA